MKKQVNFPYETKKSTIFKEVKRPTATVDFWSEKFGKWISYNMIIDTGADYTILPFSDATDLGVDLEKDCQTFETRGVGGAETVYFLKKGIKIKIDELIQKEIPVGFSFGAALAVRTNKKPAGVFQRASRCNLPWQAFIPRLLNQLTGQ